MKADLTAEIKWQQEYGDGSNCYVCGDQCWFSQYRCIMEFNNNPEYQMETDIVVCAGCGEALIEDKE